MLRIAEADIYFFLRLRPIFFRNFRRGIILAGIHKGVELGFVFGLTKVIEVIIELGLFVFESFQGFFAVGVKGRVAA